MSGQTTDELAARRALIEPLTERERTILRYLTSALSSAEIATELYLSVTSNTVKTHQRTVYRKLGVQGRREAVRRARALRLG
jgi:LuxR family transcriptional regulator, maltose regulon positive regulatory protein